MFHDQHVLTNGMYLPFCLFMSYPEPSMGISSVGSFPVWSGGSLIIFQLFRCRNLALNRMFLQKSLEVGMRGFTLRGAHMPTICLYTPVHLDALPDIWTSQLSPVLPCAYVFWGISACDMGILGNGASIWLLLAPLCVQSPHIAGAYPHICIPPCSPVHLCSRGYMHVIWGIHPLYVRVWGNQQVCQEFWCLSVHLQMSLCHAVVLFFVVFIMPQVSATTAMNTTPPVTVVSSGMSSISSVTMAPSLTGLPTTFGQCDVVLLPPMTPNPGGVFGLASVPQQQPPSSMPLQAYANYAIGSPQVGFFFRV